MRDCDNPKLLKAMGLPMQHMDQGLPTMTRAEEFLWIVQTALIANAVNLATDEKTKIDYRDAYSSTGVRIVMREAIRASKLIPEGMDVADAADEFCISMFRNHQDAVKRDEPEATVPNWFAR